MIDEIIFVASKKTDEDKTSDIWNFRFWLTSQKHKTAINDWKEFIILSKTTLKLRRLGARWGKCSDRSMKVTDRPTDMFHFQ